MTDIWVSERDLRPTCPVHAPCMAEWFPSGKEAYMALKPQAHSLAGFSCLEPRLMVFCWMRTHSADPHLLSQVAKEAGCPKPTDIHVYASDIPRSLFSLNHHESGHCRHQDQPPSQVMASLFSLLWHFHPSVNCSF